VFVVGIVSATAGFVGLGVLGAVGTGMGWKNVGETLWQTERGMM